MRSPFQKQGLKASAGLSIARALAVNRWKVVLRFCCAVARCSVSPEIVARVCCDRTCSGVLHFQRVASLSLRGRISVAAYCGRASVECSRRIGLDHYGNAHVCGSSDLRGSFRVRGESCSDSSRTASASVGHDAVRFAFGASVGECCVCMCAWRFTQFLFRLDRERIFVIAFPPLFVNWTAIWLCWWATSSTLQNTTGPTPSLTVSQIWPIAKASSTSR